MRNRNKAVYWIERLGLKPHPEGGHYSEVYRSAEFIPEKGLPKRYTGKRAFSTSIYFLLKKDEISAFHRLKSDEIWYFHDGDPLEIFIITKSGKLEKVLIGLDDHSNPQFTIKQGDWFAAKTKGDFTLLGCQVAPGFDFADFELATFEKLFDDFPHYKEIIRQFTI